MGSPIDLVTRCNNNQRFPVNGDVFVPCLSLCEPQKEAPLRFPIHGGLSLSLSSLFCTGTFVAYVFKVRVLRLSFSMVGVREGGAAKEGAQAAGNTKRGAFLQSSERQLFALNYKWTRLTPSHLSVSDDERREQHQSEDR